MMKKIDVFIDKIKSAKSIAIFGHKNPDGDCLCSALALMKIIELNFGKSSTVIYDGNIPLFLEEVPLRKSAVFHRHLPENSKFDLCIIVDYGTRKHLAFSENFVKDADYIIEFDHHYNEDLVGNLCFDDVTKAATSQIIYDVVRKAKLKTDKDIIDLLTIALITDTGNFKFVRNSKVFEDAAELVKAGADINALTNLLDNSDKKTVIVESEAVANSEFLMKNKLVIATIKKEDYKKLDGRGELVLSILGKIHGVEYVVLLKEQKENQIGVSLRSKKTPINHIAESFGGGGHLCAAGAVITDSLENVHDKIVEAFKGM
ncbi:MAG: DHH family phosphoesterase [Alphaproteobacteria bacterium]|nr:DHH family phosphoesterase [Alphaproteobacteria bacterium]